MKARLGVGQRKALIVAEIERTVGLPPPFNDLEGDGMGRSGIIDKRGQRHFPRVGNGNGWVDTFTCDVDRHIAVNSKIDGKYLRE